MFFSGVLAALGGAYLSIGQSSLFTRNMTAGRGFIALAALDLRQVAARADDAGVPAVRIRRSADDPDAGSGEAAVRRWLPVQFVQMIPYVVTIIVLAGFIGHSRAPARSAGRTRRNVERTPLLRTVHDAAARVRSTSASIPDVAVVLGSGLGDFASSLGSAVSIPYGDIPHWPVSSVVGHDGRLVIGEIAGRRVAALSGRAHFYEGHDLRTVDFATRVIGRLGVKTLILTNAAGGINTAFAPGALMVIDDHINLLGTNPLVGPNDDRFGVRFPDMSEVYSPRLRRVADDVAATQGIALGMGSMPAATVRRTRPRPRCAICA